MPISDCQVSLGVKGTLTKAYDLTTVSAPLTFGRLIALASGTGANQADKMFSDTRTLAPSATETLDLAGTALEDAAGDPLTFARVKCVAIVADAANTNMVVVGNTGSTFVGPFGAAAHTHSIRAGGFYAWAAPDITAYTVTPTSADLLQIANSGGGTSVTYSIVIIGASA